jgi:hypothetical protein
MDAEHPPTTTVEAYRRLVQRLLEGGIPRGTEFDACRAVLSSESTGDASTHALCLLLEGALADPTLNIDDTQMIVPLLKHLARGTVSTTEVV